MATSLSTSTLASTMESMPLLSTAYRATAPSNHATRRARPVVVPDSTPTSRMRSPSSPVSSVGNAGAHDVTYGCAEVDVITVIGRSFERDPRPSLMV
jgi:hypothetical protein